MASARPSSAGDQALDAECHVGESAGGIRAAALATYPRSYVDRPAGIPAGCLEQRGDARLHAAGADPLEALMHQDTVVAVQPHDVGDGTECDQRQQLGEIGLAATEG